MSVSSEREQVARTIAGAIIVSTLIASCAAAVCTLLIVVF